MDLLAAAADGDTHTIASILNSKSIDINFQNKVNGWTALHWACKKNQIPSIKLLLAHGAKNIKNFKDQTPLDVAQYRKSVESLFKDTSELLESVVEELSAESLERILKRYDLVSKNDLLDKLKV
jgi:ankyrin repeat protein